MMTGKWNGKRGVSMAGFLPFMVLIGVLCAAVVETTMHSRKASGDAVMRLQTRMAAEGAALMVAKDSLTTGTLTVGDCEVAVSDGGLQGTDKIIGLNVKFVSDPMKSYADNYTAVFDGASTEVLRLKGVYGGGGL